MSAVTLANGKTSVHINGRLVAVGITRTGLSLREVARRCDVTFNIIYRITKDNEYSGDLPIRHLVQLARLLDLTLADPLNMDPLPNEHPDLPPPDLTGDDTDPVEADAERLAAVIALSPLNTCQIILHASRWAHTYRDAQGALQAFPPEVEILPRETANIREQNDLLARYEARFLAAFPAAAIVRSDLGQADEAHRWGLSPFHYVDAYYEDIRGQLARLGAV